MDILLIISVLTMIVLTIATHNAIRVLNKSISAGILNINSNVSGLHEKIISNFEYTNNLYHRRIEGVSNQIEQQSECLNQLLSIISQALKKMEEANVIVTVEDKPPIEEKIATKVPPGRPKKK